MQASLQARVSAQIREGIVTGEYEAGAGLSEVALADELGVSRTPVREALKQLENEGLVRIVPRVGTFVAVPSRRDVAELYALREIFEGLAARCCAERGGHVAERLAARTGDQVAFVAELLASADSVKLALTHRWHANQLASFPPPSRGDAAAAELALVVARIAAKDAFGAEDAMRDHVRADLRALMREVPG